MDRPRAYRRASTTAAARRLPRGRFSASSATPPSDEAPECLAASQPDRFHGTAAARVTAALAEVLGSLSSPDDISHLAHVFLSSGLRKTMDRIQTLALPFLARAIRIDDMLIQRPVHAAGISPECSCNLAGSSAAPPQKKKLSSRYASSCSPMAHNQQCRRSQR